MNVSDPISISSIATFHDESEKCQSNKAGKYEEYSSHLGEIQLTCCSFCIRFCEKKKLLRMYCIDTGAIAFMFNGGSFCTSTMNHDMYMHLCFLAPQVYLCSTSLNSIPRISTTFTVQKCLFMHVIY